MLLADLRLLFRPTLLTEESLRDADQRPMSVPRTSDGAFRGAARRLGGIDGVVSGPVCTTYSDDNRTRRSRL